MNNLRLEPITEHHLPQVTAIYNHYIQNTTATFHTHALTPDEMRSLVFFEQLPYQTHIIMDDDTICGYVLLTRHKPREAYNNTAEVTIYLHPDSVGHGIGHFALRYMEEKAMEHKLHVLVATICGENQQSIGLFEKNGYTRCAHYREVGQKFGKYLDVVAYQKILS